MTGKYEEYPIHDYELLCSVYEHTLISEVNRLCEAAEELEDSVIYYEHSEIQRMRFNILDELPYNVDDIMWKKQDS